MSTWHLHPFPYPSKTANVTLDNSVLPYKKKDKSTYSTSNQNQPNDGDMTFPPELNPNHAEIAAVGTGGTGSGGKKLWDDPSEIAAVGTGGTGGIRPIDTGTEMHSGIKMATALGSLTVWPLLGGHTDHSEIVSASGGGGGGWVDIAPINPDAAAPGQSTNLAYNTNITRQIHEHLKNELSLSIDNHTQTTLSQILSGDFSGWDELLFEGEHTLTLANSVIKNNTAIDLLIDDGEQTLLNIPEMNIQGVQTFCVVTHDAAGNTGTADFGTIYNLSNAAPTPEHPSTTELHLQLDLTNDALTPWLSQFLSATEINAINALPEQSFYTYLDLQITLALHTAVAPMS